MMPFSLPLHCTTHGRSLPHRKGTVRPPECGGRAGEDGRNKRKRSIGHRTRCLSGIPCGSNGAIAQLRSSCDPRTERDPTPHDAEPGMGELGNRAKESRWATCLPSKALVVPRVSRRLVGRSSDSQACQPFGRFPTGRRFPIPFAGNQCDSCVRRSCSPLRGSSGFKPDSLFAPLRAPYAKERTNVGSV